LPSLLTETAPRVVQNPVRFLTLALALWLLAAVDARADAPRAPVHTISPFWKNARSPDARRVETLLRQGRAQLYPALGLGLMLGSDLSTHRRVAVENAIARFERARRLAPDDPEVLYLCGKALALWERRGPSGRLDRRSRDAISRFEALRRVDPLYEAEDVAFELGVLFTREGDYGRAAAEYERALSLRIDETSRGTILGNLAEVTMMSGNLEEAVHYYERAIQEGGSDERLLSLWGLAVALDRLGEHAEALERARKALRDDQRPMAVLKQSTVFFVPPYESHYYDGIGLLAMAEEQAGEDGSAEQVARDAAKVLAQGASLTSLVALKQVLDAIAGEGHKEAVQHILPLVDKALAKAQAQRRGESRPVPEEASLDARELRVLLSVAQALRAFTRYLDQGGKQGPWADDAEAHVDEIARWFAKPTRNGKSAR
jgi:tetratricopeptide (TPR) repeat protein